MKEATEKKPRTRTTYDPGYQLKIAKMVKSLDDVRRVAEKTSVHPSTVHLWYLTLRALGEDHFGRQKSPKGKDPALADLEARVSRIETELGMKEKEP